MKALSLILLSLVFCQTSHGEPRFEDRRIFEVLPDCENYDTLMSVYTEDGFELSAVPFPKVEFAEMIGQGTQGYWVGGTQRLALGELDSQMVSVKSLVEHGNMNDDYRDNSAISDHVHDLANSCSLLKSPPKRLISFLAGGRAKLALARESVTDEKAVKKALEFYMGTMQTMVASFVTLEPKMRLVTLGAFCIDQIKTASSELLAKAQNADQQLTDALAKCPESEQDETEMGAEVRK